MLAAMMLITQQSSKLVKRSKPLLAHNKARKESTENTDKDKYKKIPALKCVT
jgi:hypothetical protein